MFKGIRFLLLFSLLLSSAATADVTLLVHGYLTKGITWDRNGIVATMAAHGWQDGGPLAPGAWAPEVQGNKTLYVVELPFTAPLLVQSDVLQAQLEQAQLRHPGESITLVGHSAGGVVARMMLVRYGAQQVTHLITIASPHLGTPRAEFGLDITKDGPFNLVKEIAGGDTYDAAQESRALFVDLLPPRRPGTALYWLNGQPHPDIDYTSVIRPDNDNIVPAASQDMNLVPELRGKSTVYFTPGSHYLKARDGLMIISILEQGNSE
ncbi:MAG: alpha/beta fold hydrolase [Pseudomonadota bacterium]